MRYHLSSITLKCYPMSIFPFFIIKKIVQVLNAFGGAALYKEKLFQLLRACIVVFIVIMGYFLLNWTLPYIYPFLFAVLLSIVLNPIVSFLEKKIRLPRGLAAFIVIVSTFIIVTGGFILLISELIQGTAYLAEHVPAHFHQLMLIFKSLLDEQILPLYEKFNSLFHSLSPDRQTKIHEYTNKLMNEWASEVAAFLQKTLMQIPGVLARLPGYAAIFLFIIMAAFFITSDWYALNKTIKRAIPKNYRLASSTILIQLQKAFCGFIKAQLILIAITAATILTGLAAAGINYALTISLFAALADILPIVGTGIIFIPWICYLFLTANYSLTIVLSILYGIVIVQRQLLEPKILANNVGLNPLAALTALFAGFQLWGAIGLIAGPFIVIAGKGLYQAGVFHKIGQFIKWN
ncbi:sporulation integral membrane protein YtvI [Lentibacillus cibarius]|uniref:Sporulation integral membrane protein YtvI n=1 Tax=Lentibacillus cibarius TaxID=2583219 RepID=A0A5S3QGY1_9BACI|nr:sporulation integral membrane protein YtvI [Lentibacillus cibarius]